MLSIIIPAREEETTIEETVMAMKNGLAISHEVIVSDGGSSDRTVEIAKRCADKVVEFRDGKPTAGRQRNDGAKAAQGEFLVFIDAGVKVSDPQKFFTRALSHFKNNPQLVGLTGPQRAFSDVETLGDKLSFGFLNAITRFQNNVLNRGEASGKFIMVKREAFEKIHGFREDLTTREDGDFFLRLSKIGRTYFDPELGIFHASRRAHKIGWLRLWSIWTLNTIHVAIFDKALSDDWKPVR